METMVGWTADLLHQHSSSSSSSSSSSVCRKDAAILDVGTGNGVLPLELAHLGFTNITGAHMVFAAVQ